MSDLKNIWLIENKMQTNMEKFKYHIKEANLNNFRKFSKKSKKKILSEFLLGGFPRCFHKGKSKKLLYD